MVMKMKKQRLFLLLLIIILLETGFIFSLSLVGNTANNFGDIIFPSRHSDLQSILFYSGQGQAGTALDWDIQQINAPNLWQKGCLGQGVNISIIDTGIDKTHPDLDDLDDNPLTNDPKIILEKSFVEGEDANDHNGHGTLMAGVAAGTGAASNGSYIGVAPQALLFNAKACDSYGNCEPDAIIAAIEWSVNNGADVISISIGLGESGDGTHLVSQAVDRAMKNGVVVVISSGNEGIRRDWKYV